MVSGQPVQATGASVGGAAESDAGRSCAVRAGGSGAVGGGAGRKEGLQMPAHHPVWLTFKDARLEEKFRIWHSTQLSKVSRGCACIIGGFVCGMLAREWATVQVSPHAVQLSVNANDEPCGVQ